MESESSIEPKRAEKKTFVTLSVSNRAQKFQFLVHFSSHVCIGGVTWDPPGAEMTRGFVSAR